MKTRTAIPALMVLFGTLATTSALAHEEYSEAIPYHWLSHIAAGTASSAARSQGFVKEDLHEEQMGGHTLHEARTQKWTPEAAAKERASQKGTDRGKDNHEEGIGGHGLYEATKKK